MTIKLPKNIQHEFEFYINEQDYGGADRKEISPRNLLNFIENNGGVVGYDNSLYKYLFDSQGISEHQLKFLNAFYGQAYEFSDELFNYKTSENQYVAFDKQTKTYWTLPNKMRGSKIFTIEFTRDQILDSPFDINKLTEIKIK